MSHNLVQVSGVAVSVPLGDNDWPSATVRQQYPPISTLSNQLSENYYTRPAQRKEFALLGRTLVKTFADYRKLTAWDAAAHIGNFTPAVLGLDALWTIPGLAVDTQTPVSILYDPSLETMSPLSSNEPLFWHGTNIFANAESDTSSTIYLRDLKLAHSGNQCLSVGNVASDSATPVGWTSTAIPVKPGTTMGVNLWVAAENMQALQGGRGGVRATMRFTDATGHLVMAHALIGGDTHRELLTGTYKYTNIDGQVHVPAGAYWMTVYLGADPSTGIVRYDDIHINMRNPIPPQFSAGQ
jgi:hypothetical protein